MANSILASFALCAQMVVVVAGHYDTMSPTAHDELPSEMVDDGEFNFLQTSRTRTSRRIPQMSLTYTLETGAEYVGQFQNGKAHGHGVLTGTNGDVYDGTFRNDIIHGKGTLSIRHGPMNGTVFSGNFENGTAGDGKVEYANGDVYTGPWQGLLKEGNGVVTWSDGRTYNGYFESDQLNGHGSIKYPDGKVYEGNFVNGQKDGPGRFYDES